MTRTTITPPDLDGEPLAALAAWLGITTGQDTATLTALLTASLDLCEAFTGSVQLATVFEEILPATTGWRTLATQSVYGIVAVEGIPAEGSRFALPVPDYAVDLSADGSGRVRIIRQGAAGRIAVRFLAGKSPIWDALPAAIRHGIIRLAAHYYRERDANGSAAPPASVAALWRPYRRVRLA